MIAEYDHLPLAGGRMTVQLRHHGGRDGVTGSCHQLQVDGGKSLLVDCGLFQGADGGGGEADEAERLRVNFPVADIVALVLSHVHIDHVGRIPWLLLAGYQGPIICSEPSAELLPPVLEDAFRLAVTGRQEVVDNYLRMVAARLVALPYKTSHRLLDSPARRVTIRLQRAGHILGSAYIECDLLDKASGVTVRVVFSGDLGSPWTPLLPAPRPPYRADLLVLESTYGDRLHEDRRTRRQRLRQVIARALADGGTVLIPAFSIGRTQEILYELEEILVSGPSGGMPGFPVILDSPLAERITTVYRQLQRWWDKEALHRLARGRNPLDFPGLVTVDGHQDHLRMVEGLHRTGRPAVVVAGSGMCTGGRIVNYLKAMLGDPRHCVLFVGYQAAGTPGRDIQRYGPGGGYVLLDGEKITIRARVETLGGYSAHADQAGLVRFATGMRTPPTAIRLVHGEAPARLALRQALGAGLQDWTID
jgi:metallo-beta-lactamase family protein